MLTQPNGQFQLLYARNNDGAPLVLPNTPLAELGNLHGVGLTNLPEWAKKMFGLYAPEPFGIFSPFLNDLFGFPNTPAVSAPVAMLRDENGEWIYAMRGMLRGEQVGGADVFEGGINDAKRWVGVVHAVAFYNLTQNLFVGEDPTKYVEEPNWEPTGGMAGASGPPIRYDAPGPVKVPLVTLPVMDQGYLLELSGEGGSIIGQELINAAASYNVRGTNIMILPAYEGTPTGGGDRLTGSDLTIWSPATGADYSAPGPLAEGSPGGGWHSPGWTYAGYRSAYKEDVAAVYPIPPPTYLVNDDFVENVTKVWNDKEKAEATGVVSVEGGEGSAVHLIPGARSPVGDEHTPDLYAWEPGQYIEEFRFDFDLPPGETDLENVAWEEREHGGRLEVEGQPGVPWFEWLGGEPVLVGSPTDLIADHWYSKVATEGAVRPTEKQPAGYNSFYTANGESCWHIVSAFQHVADIHPALLAGWTDIFGTQLAYYLHKIESLFPYADYIDEAVTAINNELSSDFRRAAKFVCNGSDVLSAVPIYHGTQNFEQRISGEDLGAYGWRDEAWGPAVEFPVAVQVTPPIIIYSSILGGPLVIGRLSEQHIVNYDAYYNRNGEGWRPAGVAEQGFTIPGVEPAFDLDAENRVKFHDADLNGNRPIMIFDAKGGELYRFKMDRFIYGANRLPYDGESFVEYYAADNPLADDYESGFRFPSQAAEGQDGKIYIRMSVSTVNPYLGGGEVWVFDPRNFEHRRAPETKGIAGRMDPAVFEGISGKVWNPTGGQTGLGAGAWGPALAPSDDLPPGDKWPGHNKSGSHHMLVPPLNPTAVHRITPSAKPRDFGTFLAD